MYFGEELLRENLIISTQLKQALKEQNQSDELLGEILLRRGFIRDDRSFYRALARHLQVEFIDVLKENISPEIIKKLPAPLALHYQALPVRFKDKTLTVALSDPLNLQALDSISLTTKYHIQAALARAQDIQKAIKIHYGVGADTIAQIQDTSVSPKTPQETQSPVESIDESASEASISKFVNQILLEAYQNRATDIHIEPYEHELSVRYRIDGTLYEASVPYGIKAFSSSISTRIKIMANLSIAEKRLPQDGRFKVRVKDVDLDLRVSFLPTAFGESIVIRILNTTQLYSLQEIGLHQDHLRLLEHLIQKPYGLIFLTGPTGSGKTTTLYSCLSRINQKERKIITIEDPIEYQLKGITQTQVNPGLGFGFKDGLRSMLRHDPDIMMVGEVRDTETAEIAVQVALTGHLVFSTLHTNDAASGITRLADMGIDSYLICSAVLCFIAQRLIRLNCPYCKVPVDLTPEIKQSFHLTSSQTNVPLYKGEGCRRCNHTGFYGRKGIFEFLVMDDDIRAMVMRHASASQIKRKALSKGMQTLRQNGWRWVEKGLTSPEEVLRVTQDG